jgi:hypothetical protein
MWNSYLAEWMGRMLVEERLREEEADRLARLCARPRPTVLRLMSWRVGALLVVLGERLKAGQQPGYDAVEVAG